jgi:hypothetical protein
MKKSQLRQIIKEEITSVLKEQEASDAVAAIEKIKTAVKELSGTSIAQEDMVLQKLLAKYTGLLGKITSYINTKYNVGDTEETPEETPEAPEEAPEAKPKPKPKVAPTVTSGAPDYSKTV